MPFEFLGQSFHNPVGGNSDGFAGIVERVLNNRAVLLLAQDDANRRSFSFFPGLSILSSQVELHLPDELGFEFANL